VLPVTNARSSAISVEEKNGGQVGKESMRAKRRRRRRRRRRRSCQGGRRNAKRSQGEMTRRMRSRGQERR
jgi:hypothetical protein